MNLKGGGSRAAPFRLRLMERSGDEVDRDSCHRVGLDHDARLTGRALVWSVPPVTANTNTSPSFARPWTVIWPPLRERLTRHCSSVPSRS